MLSSIDRLHRIAHQTERRIIGLMSGTSLDGLDIALCRFSGNGNSVECVLEHFITMQYSPAQQEAIRAVFAKRQLDLQDLCILNAEIGILHAKMIKQVLASWDVNASSVDLIASHGQTVFHAPQHFHQLARPNSTLQIGDGDHIACATGIITLSDFRQKHIAAGGEGAPLVGYGDFLTLKSKVHDRVLLNIGGIANITYIPKAANFDQLVCSDIGPGNTLIDACAQRFFGQAYDKDSALARAGAINNELLARLLADPFFAQALPKSTGPEQFNFDWLTMRYPELASMPSLDLIATLTALTAKAICSAIKQLTLDAEIYVSGGGAHNPLLCQLIERELNQVLYPSDKIGIAGDAKEAVLFAALANECVAGNVSTFEASRTDMPNISMGKISLPE